MCASTTRVGKDKILDIAEGLFTEQGYKSVSIRDIAQACGVTNAALYYHFENKEALFAEVLENHVKRLSDHMRASASREKGIRHQLIAMLSRYASLAGHRRPSRAGHRRRAIVVHRLPSPSCHRWPIKNGAAGCSP